MDAEVFWISATQLEFCGRIYTWDGWCWTDKNGVSRTLYLRDKGVIMAGCKGGSKGKKQKGDSKGRNNKGDNKGKKAKDIQFDGDNKDDDNKYDEEDDNKEGDKAESDNKERRYDEGGETVKGHEGHEGGGETKELIH